MSRSVHDLISIKDLPSFLRTDHCYNDLQHAMLVILFRHALTALRDGNTKYADKLIDNNTLYLYIHFLNEEEGMAYKMTRGQVERDGLEEHSEMHVRFMDFWKKQVLIPYKNHEAGTDQTMTAIAKFYNLLIEHIDTTDKVTYGPEAISEDDTRTEMARIAATNMPMSPFMTGAYDTVRMLDPEAAALMNAKRLAPMALQPLKSLSLIPNVGRILKGGQGSLRDTFAARSRGDLSAAA